MIVDFHTHIFPPDVIADRDAYVAADPTFAALYASSVAKIATADDLLASMDAAGVDVSVALGFAWSDLELCRRHNDYLLEAAAKSGGRIVPFCTVQWSEPGTATRDEVERCARGGARGLGELRPDDQGYGLVGTAAAELLGNLARELSLALLFHVSEPVGHSYPGKGGLSVADCYRFAAAWPGVPIVGAHWGGGLPFYALMPEVRHALQDVYFDTAASSLLYDESVYRIGAELVGADRVLFGSDFPLLSQKTSRRRVDEAGLGEAAAAVLGENARRLLRLP